VYPVYYKATYLQHNICGQQCSNQVLYSTLIQTNISCSIQQEKNSHPIMTDRKRERPALILSKRSLSSLSDTVIKAGRKAKQKAIKTVKSLTALIKKPQKSQVILDSDSEFYSISLRYHANTYLLTLISKHRPQKCQWYSISGPLLYGG